MTKQIKCEHTRLISEAPPHVIEGIRRRYETWFFGQVLHEARYYPKQHCVRLLPNAQDQYYEIYQTINGQIRDHRKLQDSLKFHALHGSNFMIPRGRFLEQFRNDKGIR